MIERDSWSTRRPGNVLAAASLGFAVITTAVVGPHSTLSLLSTGAGVVGLTIGLSRDDRRIAGFGVFALLAGVLAAGGAGVPPERLLPATATGLLAWELGAGSFDYRTQLRGGTTERSELLHVVSATSAGALVTGFTYGFSEIVTVGVSTLGVTLLLVAAVALGLALRE